MVLEVAVIPVRKLLLRYSGFLYENTQKRGYQAKRHVGPIASFPYILMDKTAVNNNDLWNWNNSYWERSCYRVREQFTRPKSSKGLKIALLILKKRFFSIPVIPRLKNRDEGGREPNCDRA